MKKAKPGFTLIEILIAMVVFSVVALITAQVLSSTLTHYQRMRAQLHRLRALQLVWVVLNRDTALALNYAIKQGKVPDSPLLGSENQVSFSRFEIRPSQGSQLVHLHYSCHGDQLIRERYPGVNTKVIPTPLSRVVLIDKLSRCQFRYLSPDGKIASHWQKKQLPRVVELTLSGAELGETKQNYLLPDDALIPISTRVEKS